MTQPYEILGVMPASNAQAPAAGLLFETAGAFTVILRKAVAAASFFPQTRKQFILETAKRQALLETCMHAGPILVVKPGSTLQTNQVPLFVKANADLFAKLTTRFEGLTQFQITVAWDAPRVLERFRNTPELAVLFQKTRVSADDVQTGIARLAAGLRAKINDILATVAADLIALPVEGNIICNAVLLVPETDQATLDSAVKAIDDIWTEGFQIKQIGPAPAASFALLTPYRVTRNDLARARELLGVSENCTFATLDAARRTSLLAAPQMARQVKDATQLLTATLDLGGAWTDLLLCDVQSETTSASQFRKAVA